MKIEIITVTQRKNCGNYEHLEISSQARLEEGDDPMTAMLTLRTYVDSVLALEAHQLNEKKEATKTEDKVIVPIDSGVTKEDLGEKKEKKKKEKKEKPETKAETPIIETYSSEKHRAILAGYLSTTYGPKWSDVKPKEEIKAFTVGLNGLPFITPAGLIVNSFTEKLDGFFKTQN